jgi:FtsP/CotA-like multicopper oxidase with cupredoxin domain
LSEEFPAKFVIEPLDKKKHDRTAFSCAHDALTTSIRQQAGQDAKKLNTSGGNGLRERHLAVLMTGLPVRSLAVIVLMWLSTPGASFAQFTPDVPRAITHDNLHPAGEFANGVLTLRLEIREASWHPDAESAPPLPVLAFGEEGKSPSVPGPLIRVLQGTRLHVSVKNRTLFPAFVHGLHQRPGEQKDILTIPPNGSRDVTFLAGDPGTYYYWAATGYDVPIEARLTWDTELSGAFVIDPPEGPTDDRIMVLGLWYTWLVPFDYNRGFHQIPTVNGKSWPHTTRLSYNLGENIHWRIINASISIHPMHLHGAHFQVDSEGDAGRDTIFPSGQRRTVVTENIAEGRTMAVTWKPTHTGNWIFHCHLAQHFEARLSDEVAEVTGTQTESLGHHDSGMAGLVVGIQIKPAEVPHGPSPSLAPTRKLMLMVSQSTEQHSGQRIHIEIKDGDSVVSTAPGSELGPTLVLHRGESTEITVVNRLTSATAIHWHGIELESYYDGVVGFGGDSQHVTPPVAPGESFVARMTPPRAGTYIYHTHWHDIDQLTHGLYGPLIVLEPGERYDPEHDRVFVASRGGPDLLWDPLLVNGMEHPAFAELHAGSRYRFRFINITPSDDAVDFSIMEAGKSASWTPLAKDGADLPPYFRKNCDAKLQFGAGETYDFEFEPQTVGNLELQAGVVMLHTTMPIPVTGTNGSAVATHSHR